MGGAGGRLATGTKRVSGERRELAGVLVYAAGLAFAALTNFAYVAIMGRRLPAHSFSTFGALLAVLLMLAGPINAISGGTEMLAARRGWFPAARLRLVMAGLGVAIVAVTSVVPSDAVRTSGWFALATILWLLLAWNRGALTGLGRFRFVGLTFAAEGTARLAIGVSLVAAGWAASGAAAGVALGMLLALLLTQSAAPRTAPTSYEPPGPEVWIAIVGLLAVQSTQFFDALAVRLFAPRGAGQYVAAASLARAVAFAQLPAAVYALRAAAMRGSRPVAGRVAVLALAPGFLALVVIEAVPGWVLRLTYGAKYAAAADLLRLLAMAMFFGGLVLVAAYLQMGEGRTAWVWPGILVGLAGTAAIALTASSPEQVAGVAVAVQVLTLLAVGLPVWQAFWPWETGGSVLFLNWRDRAHPQGGGSEAYVEQVARRLAEEGRAVTIFCSQHERAPREEIRDGIRFVRRGGWRSVYLWAALYHLTGKLGPHQVVVDVQNGIPFCSPLYCGRPVVVLVHHIHRIQWSMNFRPRLARFGWWVESRFAPWLYRRARYVAVSEATRRDLSSLGVRHESISVVRNGGDPPAPRATGRSAVPTVVALGRLVPHKRLEILLAATATLREDFPELRTVVVGEGPWEDRLRAEADRLGLDGTLEFAGWVDEQTRDRLLEEAWVLAMPSVWEGWGLAVTEAAAHSTPAVAFRAGGLEESIDDGLTGLLVDDEAGFVGALRLVLSDEGLRQRMGAAAERGAWALSWDLTAEGFAAALDEALAPDSARTAVPVAELAESPVSTG